jgi:predicted nucleic acid-binding protein
LSVRRPPSPIGFDSTVLINFGECGALTVLVDATSAPRFVVGPVRAELLQDPTRHAVDAAIAGRRLTATDLEPSELVDWARLGLRLGAGESATIAAAIGRGWTVACDDQAARRLVLRELGHHRLIGTIGILVRAIERCTLTRVDAEKLLQRMIANGYWSPVRELPHPD